MIIRKATINDFESLKEIKLLSKKEELKYSKTLKPLKKSQQYYFEYLQTDLKKKNTAIFVAEDKKIIGMIVGTFFKPLRISLFSRKGYISNLYVDNDFRNKKIGEKLVKKIINWFKANDVNYISLEIHLENKSALDFYSKMGFKKYTIKLDKKI